MHGGAGPVQHAPRGFLPFDKALGVHALPEAENAERVEGLGQEWRTSCQHPSTLDKAYTHEGWQDRGHWRGTGTVAPQNQVFLPFTKALPHAHTLKLTGKAAWDEWRGTACQHSH